MSDGLPWYKCDPRDFNDGMTGLSRCVRGTYATVLNCIYIEGGPVADNTAYWVAKLECSAKEWRADRALLIQRRKLQVVTVDGVQCLANPRAEREIKAYWETIQKRSRAGKASVAARGMHLKIVK